MPFNYAAQRLRADRMIARYGASTAKLRRGTVDRLCTAVEISYTPFDRRRPTNPTDRQVLVSALAPTGAVLDPPPDQQQDILVMFDPNTGLDQELRLTEPVGRLAPAGLVVFWDLTVRG